jgi:hypothetical protein
VLESNLENTTRLENEGTPANELGMTVGTSSRNTENAFGSVIDSTIDGVCKNG